MSFLGKNQSQSGFCKKRLSHNYFTKINTVNVFDRQTFCRRNKRMNSFSVSEIFEACSKGAHRFNLAIWLTFLVFCEINVRTLDLNVTLHLVNYCSFKWLSNILDYVIAIATFSDWFKNLAPAYQPIRRKTKTNHDLHTAQFFQCFEQVTCMELLQIWIGSLLCLHQLWSVEVVTFNWCFTTLNKLKTFNNFVHH